MSEVPLFTSRDGHTITTLLFSGRALERFRVRTQTLKGYLAHKKQRPPRNLQ